MDYYRVPQGRPTSEGTHLRRGVHVSSQDRDARKIRPSGRLLQQGSGSRSPVSR